MRTSDVRRRGLRSVRLGLASALCLGAIAACSGGGSDGLADSGGMSGTGASEGAITSFGSIFVNGVEWDVGGATIMVDGVVGGESDLRVGMVVRVEGDFDASGASGRATEVRYDDLVEGPISATPVETVPGIEKQFSILGRMIVVDAVSTVFDEGASFGALSADDVIEVTGFEDQAGRIRATRVALRTPFPGNDDVELRGSVSSLVVNMDATGIFDLASITVRFDAATTFDGVTRAALTNGDLVEVEGTLRPSGSEIDAREVQLRTRGFGAEDRPRVEIEGVVRACVESPDFCVGSVPVDASASSFEPVGFVPMSGARVEVEGALVAGTLRADRIEEETESGAGAGAGDARDVRIEAAVTSVDAVSQTLEILGVTVEADPSTSIRDESSAADESFQFSEIMPGDFLEIRGVDEGGATVRAFLIQREDATPGSADVRLQGPVTAFSVIPPYSLSILDQPVPIVGSTLFFDSMGVARSATEFFQSPGIVMIGDVVRAEQEDAPSLSTLTVADEIEIEDPS